MNIVLRIRIPFYQLYFDATLPDSMKIGELLCMLPKVIQDIDLEGFQLYLPDGSMASYNQSIEDLHLYSGSQVMIL